MNCPNKAPKTPLHPHSCGAPFEKITLNILDPLPTSRMGNRYILVMIDYFTKWPEAFALPDHQAETVLPL